MCSIIGSFSKDKIIELAKLNAYRGQHSWSITYLKNDMTVWGPSRFLGEFKEEGLDPHGDEYMIVHQQAPTTDDKSDERIHPAAIDGNLLWHNGILKDDTIKYLQDRTQFNHETWDTYLLLSFILKEDNLNMIDGSFSCLMYRKDIKALLMFRNEIAPMFFDKDMNISSTEFEGSQSTKPNVVTCFDPFDRIHPRMAISSFKTVDNPYFFAE